MSRSTSYISGPMPWRYCWLTRLPDNCCSPGSSALPTFLNGSEKGYLLETCAGLIDEGETPEQAARREVEEDRYPVTELTKIGGVYSSAGGITEFLHLFTAKYDHSAAHGTGGGKAGEGEDIALVLISFDEACEQLQQGMIRDAKTLILLQHYFRNS